MLLVLGSCRATKYLEKDQALIKAVKIRGINKNLVEQAEQYVQNGLQKNSRFNLALYNTFNTKKGKYRTDKIKSIGEAPHLLDSSLLEISRSEIEKFLKTKGYFNAKVKAEVQKKDQRAYITFLADTSMSFKIGSISHTIPDTAVRKLYEAQVNNFTHIHQEKTYDQDSLVHDRDKIHEILGRNGYYEYLKSYMTVNLDTTKAPFKTDVHVYIDNPPGELKHQTYTFNESFIAIRNSKGHLKRDGDTTTLDGQYHFTSYSNNFNKKIIKRYLFINKDELYNIDNYNLTRDRLYALNIFRNIKIDLKKTADSTNRLNAYYDLTPSKKMSNRIEAACQINNVSNGFKFANTYANKNLFGGAELFEFRASYDIQFDATYDGFFQQVLSRDFNIGVSLSFPKLIPFNFSRLSRNGVPRTIFVSNFEFFDQRNQFTNRIFINSMTYNWIESPYRTHSFTPINVEYRVGEYTSGFRTTLIDQGYSLLVATNDRTSINLGSRYMFIYNAIKLKELSNFNYFSLSLGLSGNTSSLLSKVFDSKINTDGTRTLLGLTYEQYVKPEIDFRAYKFLGNNNQLVIRINPGIVVPYGNTKELTFEKLFFGGGSQGMRAWQGRTLGPGAYNRATISTEATRNSLRGLDQIGEIKLEANVEYRFKLITKLLGGSLKGAIFGDFGNVWRLTPNTLNPGGEFKVDSFMKQIAIGSGLGLRFDVNYFILRLDLGIKVKDPQFTDSDQWVIRHFFNRKEFKERYAATNAPDVYSFLNFNIGIGMPF